MSNRRKLKRRPGPPTAGWGAAGSMTEAEQKEFRDSIERVRLATTAGMVGGEFYASKKDNEAVIQLGMSIVMTAEVLRVNSVHINLVEAYEILNLLDEMADFTVHQLRHEIPGIGGPKSGKELLASIPYTQDKVLKTMDGDSMRTYGALGCSLLAAVSTSAIGDSDVRRRFDMLLQMAIAGVCSGGSFLTEIPNSDPVPYMGNATDEIQ